MRTREWEDLEFNVYTKHGFELDVWDPVSRTNVELDGPQHARVRRRRRSALRDAALARAGIRTLRLRLAEHPDAAGPAIAALLRGARSAGE